MTKTKRAILLAHERGYRVSDAGVILGIRGKPLKVSVYKASRYPSFGLSKVPFTNTNSIKITIHRFAAYCFYGDAVFEEGIEVRHLNGNVFDFSKDNIALGTSADNKRDTPIDIHVMKNAKLNHQDVRHIRQSFENGSRAVSLSEEYGVCVKTIYNTINKETFAHVD